MTVTHFEISDCHSFSEAFTVAMAGLLIGGIAAAPLGGYAAKKVPARALMIMGGIVLTLTSAYGIYNALT